MARDFQEYRRPLWPMLAAFGSVLTVAACCVTVALVAGAKPTGGGGNSDAANAALGTPMHESGSLSKPEETVKAFILDNANNPKSVEFSRWGPNIKGEDYLATADRSLDRFNQTAQEQYAKHPGSAPPPPPLKRESGDTIRGIPMKGAVLVRVRYRASLGALGPKVYDQIYVVPSSGKPTQLSEMGSDDWIIVAPSR